MMKNNDTTPILVGVGQVCSRWSGDDVADAPSPLSLAFDASKAAIEDCAASSDVRAAIDVVAVVRTIDDSTPFGDYSFGRCTNPPRTLAHKLGIEPKRAIYTDLGGETPQSLVNEFAASVHAGTTRMALLSGAEAIGAFRTAKRNDLTPDWSESVEGPMEDRHDPEELVLSDYELSGGFGYPTWVYPLFENALRARQGRSREDHLKLISKMFAGFSEVAANNPYAQFPKSRSAEFLAEVSAENYPIAEPYLKWHVAQDAVNQGAAVLVTTVATATELGIPEDKWVYLHGYAEVKDKLVTEREDMLRGRAMDLAVSRALESCGKTAAEIDHFELYSCFPIAVLRASESLGVSFEDKTFTQTGGLPFFGGPGNNFMMHGIAAMTETLRADRGSFGFVLGNGGFFTKEAAGIYSTEAPESWAPVSCEDLQATLNAQKAPTLMDGPCEGTIETYTVVFRRSEPHFAVVVARVGDDWVVARSAGGDREAAARFLEGDPIGDTVRIDVKDGKRFIAA